MYLASSFVSNEYIYIYMHNKMQFMKSDVSGYVLWVLLCAAWLVCAVTFSAWDDSDGSIAWLPHLRCA